MTILFTLVGMIVFIVSLFTAGFKSSVKRLAAFAIVGLCLDTVIVTTTVIATYVSA